MTDEQAEMMKRLDDFLFKPPIEGKPSRAQQIDELLAAVRAGKMGTRLLLWLAGVVAASTALWATISGGGGK